MIYYVHYPSPIGILRLRACDDGLLAVDHTCQQETIETDWMQNSEHLVIKHATKELTEYFTSQRRAFSVPLCPQGTDFQCLVWEQLRTIPFGETRSYSEIAVAIGKPDAVRAVGAANGKNPLSIFVPCHRVIGKSGKLTGYAGGMDAKRILLAHEVCLANNS